MTFLLAAIAVQAPLGPTLPPRVRADIYSANESAQRALEAGRWQEAQDALAGWPIGELRFQIKGDCPEGREALAGAERAWRSAVPSFPRLSEGERPGLIIEFVSHMTLADTPPGTADGIVVAKIPLSFGGTARPMPKRTLVQAAARALGVGIGMAPTTRRGGVLGLLDPLEQGIDILPTQGERESLARLIAARGALDAAIREKRRLTPAAPRLELTAEGLNGGQVPEGSKTSAKLTLVNRGTAPVEFSAEITCRCLFIEKMEPLKPGELREIEAGIDTTGFPGRLEKAIRLHTNDASDPVREVVLSAESIPEYRVVPDALEKVPLLDEGHTDFEIVVYGFPGKPLRVTGATTSKTEATATVAPFQGEVLDPLFGDAAIRRTGYKVRVRFSPAMRAGLDWTKVLIQTTSESKPTYDVTLETRKGIVAEPSALYFGGVPADQESTRSIRIYHHSTSFEIVDIAAEGGAFGATWEREGDSKNSYRVNVVFRGGNPGAIVGRLVVKTNHPQYKEVVVPIGGTAR